jgi:hypothetical protein
MLDLVLAENLPKLAGIESLQTAKGLKNFRQPKDAAAARGDCRMKGALVHLPSYEFEEGSFKELAKSGGAVVFSFGGILPLKGFRRSIMLSKMRLAFSSCRRAGCGAVACTLAADERGLRNAREIAAFMAVLGMDQHERKFSEKLLEGLAGGKA